MALSRWTPPSYEVPLMALVLRSPTETLAPLTAWAPPWGVLCWVLLSVPRLQVPPMARAQVLQSGSGRPVVLSVLRLQVPPMARAQALQSGRPVVFFCCFQGRVARLLPLASLQEYVTHLRSSLCVVQAVPHRQALVVCWNSPPRRVHLVAVGSVWQLVVA